MKSNLNRKWFCSINNDQAILDILDTFLSFLSNLKSNNFTFLYTVSCRLMTKTVSDNLSVHWNKHNSYIDWNSKQHNESKFIPILWFFPHLYCIFSLELHCLIFELFSSLFGETHYISDPIESSVSAFIKQLTSIIMKFPWDFYRQPHKAEIKELFIVDAVLSMENQTVKNELNNLPFIVFLFFI